MKKMLAIMLVLLFLSAGFAEEAVNPNEISLTLPEGLVQLTGDDLAGYEAAVEADFPESGRTILAAVSEDAAQAVTVMALESDLDGAEAAKHAAEKILGSTESVFELALNEKRFGSFTCAVGDLLFELYYIDNAGTLFIIGVSGLEKAEIEEMLGGILF